VPRLNLDLPPTIPLPDLARRAINDILRRIADVIAQPSKLEQTMDAGSNRISNLADAREPGDALSMRFADRRYRRYRRTGDSNIESEGEDDGGRRRIKATLYPGEAGFLPMPIRRNEIATPVEAYITAETTGGDDTTIDVLYSVEDETVAPVDRVWLSLFPSGSANKLILPADQERRAAPLQVFASPLPRLGRYAMLKPDVVTDSASGVVVVIVFEVR